MGFDLKAAASSLGDALGNRVTTALNTAVDDARGVISGEKTIAERAQPAPAAATLAAATSAQPAEGWPTWAKVAAAVAGVMAAGAIVWHATGGGK